MPWLSTPHASVYFEANENGGDWVTLINGFSRSSRDFRALVRVLADQGYSVLTFDNRGAGETKVDGDFSTPDIVADVTALWSHLDISQSHVLGISYGGVISQYLVTQHPKLVRSLCLVSTAPNSRFIRIDNNLVAMEGEQLDHQLRRYFSRGFLEKNAILSKALLQELRKGFLDPATRTKLASQRRAMGTFDFETKLSGIAIACLILHGEEDQVISVDAAYALSKALPQSQLETLPDVGHLLLAECPRVLYERYTKYLISLS